MPNRMIVVHRTPADAEIAFAGVFYIIGNFAFYDIKCSARLRSAQ